MTEGSLPQPTGQAARWPRRHWQREFPYHWDADDVISRRELLNFAVYSSGALFVATAILAGLGFKPAVETPAPQPVAKLADLAPGSAVYFHYPAATLGDEAMLLRLPDGRLVAYSQTCTHLSCGVLYQPDKGRLFCPCHEGVFDPATGDPIAGPPQRRLTQISVREEGGTVFATDWTAS